MNEALISWTLAVVPNMPSSLSQTTSGEHVMPPVIEKRLLEKKKEIFFSCFPRDTPLDHWTYQCHTPNYPALSMCMPLTIRV